MTPLDSDAFVFFGATGDLAYKKIFPALYAMVRRSGLAIPIIGMARAGWTLDKLRARALASVENAATSIPVASRNWRRNCATWTAITRIPRPS